MIKINFANNMKTLRSDKKIGQSTLAEALNVSIKTISHWETGSSEPSIAQLVQIADFLDVTLDELVGKI